MSKIWILSLSGAAGTLARYALGGFAHQIFGSNFPYGTLIVNLCGCLAIGFLATLFESKWALAPEWRIAIFIGFIGAFTTYSSFAYETWALFKDGQWLFAAFNTFGSLILGFAALFVGVVVARMI